MATELAIYDMPLEAGEDLSSNQYYLVGGNSSKKAMLADGGVDVLCDLGILQNKPQSGEGASIRILGISKAVAGGTFAAFDPLKGDGSAGKLVKQTSGRSIARALEAGATGRTVSVLLLREYIA